MRLIDAHAHLWPGGGDVLLAAMDAAGIERACVSGLGPLFGMASDEDVLVLARAHPDRIVPFACVRPGLTHIKDVRARLDEGFCGLKVTCPSADYDSPAHLDLWALAEERGAPVLFHTGVVTVPNATRDDDVNSARMNPILLAPIARAFPHLRIICAHLGIHWNDEAAEIARFFPNVRVDLTGELTGWRARWSAADLSRFLWWSGAWKQVIFGTDVRPGDVKAVVARDRALWDELDLDETTRRKIAIENALWWLGEKEDA